ncbi:MAG: head GIN domain-containing protein [Chthoniobacterales bacterium]
MKTKLLFSGLALVVLCTSGCDLKRLRGNGNVTTQTRPVTDFSKLDAGGYYEVEWHPGAPSLSIKTDENLLEHITTKVVGDRLKIEMEEPVAPTDGIKVVVTSPSLGTAELSGAVEFTAASLSGEKFVLQTSGATKVTLSGQVNRLLADLTGASKLEAGELRANDVELSVTGAGKANVTASNSLRAAITGAGKVLYGGQPKTVEKRVTGAGKIEPRDAQ